MGKKLVILATPRYAINFNDFYLFYRRTEHRLVAILLHSKITTYGWWTRQVYRRPYGAGPAREDVYDVPNPDVTPIKEWNSIDELLSLLDDLEFDYLCMGNGSGAEQHEVIQHIGVERCLFSEYGWLPWSKHFYISRQGCGDRSEIATMTTTDLEGRPIPHAELQSLRQPLDTGLGLWPWRRDYIYVPLQKDVDDFKFTLTHFRNNQEFLDFIHEIVPKEMTVVIKRHPLFKKVKYKINHYGRFLDITDRPFLNKADIYRRMAAMVVVNSTSVLEALLFHGKVFAYGKDIFLNKDVVEFQINDLNDFALRLNQPVRTDLCDAFLALLLERQIHRKRCMDHDESYIHQHYWNQSL